MNANQKVQQVKDTLDGARIAKATREDIDRQLNALRSGQPVSVETVPNPLVDPEWYSGKYYWENHDRAAARILNPAAVDVRAVNIDAMSEREVEERRSPSSWSPRVEVRFEARDHVVVGDLTAEAAIDLATELLAAARLIQH